MDITYLEITTWAGFVPGAMHYYGALHREDVHKDVKRQITAAEAEAWNARDYGAGYCEGDRTTRWDSKEELIAEAIRTWKERIGGDVLLQTGEGYLDPCPVLDGPGPLVKAANKLYARAKLIGFWDRGHEAIMKQICARWDRLFGR